MKTTILTLLLSCIFLISFQGCKHRHAPSSELEASLDSIFTGIFRPGEPGAVVLVAKGDSIIYIKSFGMARLDTKEPMTDTTLLNICSISKQFSAAAVLKLREMGLAELDTPFVQYLPEYSSPLLKDITLRQLLTHTSGIPDTRPRTEEQWQKYISRYTSIYTNVDDYKKYAQWEESCRYLTGLESLAFEPGTEYEYQNPTYQLVEPLVERLTHEDFNYWMRDYIFYPAGLVRTRYFRPERAMKTYAHGYIPASGENTNDYFRSADGKWEECDYGEAAFFPTKADGALYTTAREFFRWKRALFSGKVLNDSSVRTMIQSEIHSDIPYTNYALGLFIDNRPERPYKIFHTGDNGGFYTYEGFYQQHDLFYLIFSNRPDWNREAVVESVDSVLFANKCL